jgi:hypothetical protein
MAPIYFSESADENDSNVSNTRYVAQMSGARGVASRSVDFILHR